MLHLHRWRRHCKSYQDACCGLTLTIGATQTPSSMTAFILAMTLWPRIQTRAQNELDALLGTSWTRLPTFADRAQLPYVNAIVLEVLRWNPAVPLGLAHRLTEDDVYRGWVIPRGTVVWANIRCITISIRKNVSVLINLLTFARIGLCCKIHRCFRSLASSSRSDT